ncbi:MAG: hypothetical protein FWC91_13800 [Defluviitaleaceae bacterium]|nr:hypothetical protein [Defluviitaleaceae bacterium]
MNKKEEILKMVLEARPLMQSSTFKMYTYKDIGKKNKDLKKFDPNFDHDDFVAIYCTTLFGSAKDGVVFNVDGIYFDDAFEKKYLNYLDIESFNVEKAWLRITPKEGGVMSIGLSCLNEYKGGEALKELLLKIKGYCNQLSEGESLKDSGKVNKKANLTKDEMVKCNAIIHPASVAAGGVGAGLAQVPGSDNLLIAPIQIAMVTSLGLVFGIRVTEGMAKSLIANLAASFAGRAASQFLVGWVPGLGNAINTATAAGLTQAVGWAAVKHFKDLQKKDMQKGRYEGMKEGYVKASREYEGKLRKQAAEFIKQGQVFKNDRQGFLTLIDDYEQYIAEIEQNESHLTDEIASLKEELSKLKNLSIA